VHRAVTGRHAQRRRLVAVEAGDDPACPVQPLADPGRLPVEVAVAGQQGGESVGAGVLGQDRQPELEAVFRLKAKTF